MKVMSFNVLCGGKDYRDWPVRANAVTAVIDACAPDLFGLQEAHKGWMDAVCAAFPAYDYVGVGRDDGKEKGEYSPVFYRRDRFELQDSGHFWLSETPDRPSKGWGAACIRICSYAVLLDKQTGTPLAAMNTHLDHISTTAMREGMALIMEQADRFGALPVVLTGDFNSEPADAPFACAMAHGFADCRAAAKTSDTRPTFHNYAQDGGKAEGVVIDYIFAKNAKTVESFRVVTDKVNGRAPSDHYPLLAEIEL